MKKYMLCMLIFSGLLTQLPVAEARDGRGGAVVAGILGLGLGMAIAAPRVRYYDDPDTVIIERHHWRPRHDYYPEYRDHGYYRHHRDYDRRDDWNDD